MRHFSMRYLSPLGALRYCLFFLFIGGAAAAAVLTWEYRSVRRAGEEDATARAAQLSAQAAEALDAALAGVVPTASGLAAEIEDKPLDDSRFGALCRQWLAAHPVASGIGFAYRPGSAPGGERLRGSYCTRAAGGDVELTRLDRLYDYSRFEHRWFNDPMLDGAMWSEPHRILPGSAPVAGYAVPFRSRAVNGDAAPLGIAFVTVSLEEIGRVVESASLGRLGYSFVFSPEGRYISHPDRQWVAIGRTVFETAWQESDTALHSLAVRGIKGEQGRISRFDPQSGQLAWTLFRPLRSSGWVLASVFDESEVRLNPNVARRMLIQISLALLVSLMGCVALGVTRWMHQQENGSARV